MKFFRKQKCFLLILAAAYFLLSAAAPFAVFHNHHPSESSALYESSPFGEMHDATCHVHHTHPFDLSDHCPACKFLAGGASEISPTVLIVSLDHSSDLNKSISSPCLLKLFLAFSPGRAPPHFFS